MELIIEKHKRFCMQHEDYSPAFEGSPYPDDNFLTGLKSSILSNSLRTCNICSWQFITIKFKEGDSRISGTYLWDGADTIFKSTQLRIHLLAEIPCKFHHV